MSTSDGRLAPGESEQRSRAIFKHAAIGMAITDAAGVFLDVNQAFSRITGYPASELASIDFQSLVHPDDRARRQALVERLLAGEIPSFVIEKRLLKKDAGLVWVRDSVSMAGEQGEKARLIVLSEDITEGKRAEENLRASEERFRMAAENASDIIYEWDLETGKVTTYGSSPQRFGHGLPENIEAFKQMVHPEDVVRVLTALRRQIENGERYCCEYRILGDEGQVYYCSDHGVALRDAAGKPYKWVGLVTDITERREAEQAISQLAAIVQGSEDAIIGISLLGSITSWNSGAEKLLGYPASQALGQPVARLLPGPSNPREVLDWIERVRHEHVIRQEEIFLACQDGVTVPVSLTVSPIRKTDGSITGVAMIARDIGERKRAEEQLAHLAWHDPLTGLPNRLLLADRLEAAISRAREAAHLTGVIYVDLDGFKFVNDTLGHEAGDALLQLVAARFSMRVRPSDTLARMGGDEFMLVVADVGSAETALLVAQRLVEVLKEPFQVADHQLYITASIGISIYPQDGVDVSTLRRAADSAMYAAKRGGKDRVRFFTPEMRTAYLERLELESDLRGALDRGELTLEFQPILRISDQRPMACEALLRWFHPYRGWVSPARFIPVAEETGLIVHLGKWVLETACRACLSWQSADGMDSVRVAVNVSALEFAMPNFVENVLAVLDRTGLRPDLVELELTESMLMHNIEDSIRKMSRLRTQGVRIAVDDFGTGYSSLGYLHRLPIDTLKIDRCFVSEIGANGSAIPLISGMISLAHSIGKRVVVEGVETEEQLDILRDIKCDDVQGLLLGRPSSLAPGFERQLGWLAHGVSGDVKSAIADEARLNPAPDPVSSRA